MNINKIIQRNTSSSKRILDRCMGRNKKLSEPNPLLNVGFNKRTIELEAEKRGINVSNKTKVDLINEIRDKQIENLERKRRN